MAQSGKDKASAEAQTEEVQKEEVQKDPPGPKDHGRDGGMATRENAPEAVQRSEGGGSADD
ncbi:hypothetical protein [Gordonia sp. 'Campus']|uniref:hypothetical protein n=1 Tax=Gordonia sp. 'Campus' TaxID=2915824 RepID=UPI001EE447DD|nr:hypothetical protein [Gordonia sp. 'Campus']